MNHHDLSKSFLPVEAPTQTLGSMLGEAAARASSLILDGRSPNSQRAFSGDLQYWKAWLGAIGCRPELRSVSLDVLRTFVIHHLEGLPEAVDRQLIERGFKAKEGVHSIATVKRRLASLSVCFEMAKSENPCRTKEINVLLMRLSKRGGAAKKKKAITKEILNEMLDTCDDSLIGIRDKALLFFAFASGGRRRSEVSAASMENLSEVDGEYLYNLNASKTNQTGEDDFKPVKGRAAKALQDWLKLSGVIEGPIFRSISKTGIIKGALSGIDIARIVKKRIALAGYDSIQFSAHSLRRGFVTEAGRQGKPLGDIMKLSSHKSINVAIRYYEAGNVSNNSCANLMG